MKKLLNRLALFCSLICISFAAQAKVTAVITISDSCENSDSVSVDANKSIVGPGDSVSYIWKFTATTSVPKAFTAVVPGLVFKDTTAFGIQKKYLNDTIWLKIYTWTPGGTTPKDSDSVMRVFTLKFNGLPLFTPTSRCADSAVSFVNNSDNKSVGNGNFTWDYGDGSATYEGVTTPNHTYPTYGTYYPVLSVYWPQTGCFNKSIKNANPTYVYRKPFAVISVSKSECQDSLVHFHDLDSSSMSNLQDHTWDFGDLSGSGTIQTDTTSHLYKTTGTKLITYTTITENGCRDTDTMTITIHPKPTADFSFSNPCQNAPASFTDKSSVSAGTITSWSWDFDDGSTSSSQNPQHTFTGAKSYNVKLTITTSSGCTDEIIQTVTINSTPLMRIDAPDECLNLTDSITDMTTYFSTDAAQKWDWDFGDKSTTSTASNTTSHKYAKAGKYHITLTATTQLGCMDTTGVFVNIFNLPTPAFTMSGSCSRDSIFFNDKSTIAAGDFIAAWNWNFGDPLYPSNDPNNISTGKHSGHIYDSAGTSTVQLTVISSNGCADSTTKSLTILQSPDTTFKSTTACENTAIQFTYTGRLTNGLKYSWNFGDSGVAGDTSTLQNPSYTYAKGGFYYVALVTKAQNGCRGHGLYFAEVFPKPIMTFTYDNVCVDSSILFTAIDTWDPNISPGTITNYAWDFGDGSAIHNTSTSDINYQYASTGVYKVTVSVSTSDGCSNSGTASVTINPLPTADFSDPAGCNETGINFTDASTGSIVKWYWDFGDGAQIDSNQNPKHIFENTDTSQLVTLVVITDKGCRATAIKPATSYQTPTSDFYFNLGAAPYKECTLDTITLSSNSSAALYESTVSSYVWLFGDSTANGTGANTSHVWTKDGPYTVRLVSFSEHGCPDTTNLKNINYKIYIYPRPVANFTVGNYTCEGAPITFTDASTFGKNSAEGFIYWDFGDGNTTINTQFPQHTYPKANTYNVRIFVSNDQNSFTCPSDTFTIPVTVYPTPIAKFGYVGTCQNRVTQFIDSSTVAAPDSMDIGNYHWDFGDNLNADGMKNPAHTYSSAGNYNVTENVESQPGGCLASLTKLIYVQPSPVAKFFATPNPVGNDTPIVTFIDSSSGDFIISRYWDYGDSTHVINPIKNVHTYIPIDPIDTGTYQVWLKLTNKYTCSDSTYQYVKIKQYLKLDGRFPSSFTPNGDGLNDVWHPITRGVFTYHCIVFDRWGQILYTTDDWNDPGWKGDYRGNGVRVPEGVYVYYAYLTDYDNLVIQKVQGTITVLY